ncbi:NUDIX domain-containing protein [Aureimonas psammosilenae]|uniref:NUDIX domain-containing protein n=1 Tax=Aureimonas psammosilenae TaxID=2495496 RepID=UPI0012612B43|nr:NUDIX domain-containing protein [Aureimonas psammosilenae]
MDVGDMGKPEHIPTSSRSGVKEKSLLLRLLDGSQAMRNLRHAAILATRPMTLGVRVAAFDQAGRLFLVRHTYMSGWYLPGGGVDPGETVAEGGQRELRGEGNLDALEPLRLVSVHFNRRALSRDHVLFMHCPLVRQMTPKVPDREIAESGFFAPDALPADMTQGTRRRIEELLNGAEPHPDW